VHGYDFFSNPSMSYVLLDVRKLSKCAAALRLFIAVYLLGCPVCSRRSKMFVMMSARVGGSCTCRAVVFNFQSTAPAVAGDTFVMALSFLSVIVSFGVGTAAFASEFPV